MNYYIYTLETNGVIFYIGKTKNIKRRYNTHRSSAKLKRTYKERFINKILLKGNTIDMLIIDEVCENDVDFWEIYWISQFKQWGFKLHNTTCGGDGGDYWTGKKHKKETIDKLKEIRAKFLSENSREMLQLPGEKNGRSKLVESQVIELRGLRDNGYSYTRLAMKYNISRTAAINIVKRKRWKHI